MKKQKTYRVIKLSTHKNRMAKLEQRINKLESVLKHVCEMSDMARRIRFFVQANTGLSWEPNDKRLK